MALALVWQWRTVVSWSLDPTEYIRAKEYYDHNIHLEVQSFYEKIGKGL